MIKRDPVTPVPLLPSGATFFAAIRRNYFHAAQCAALIAP
jgi:hypothetical protein